MNTNQKSLRKLKRPRKLLGRDQGKIGALQECGCHKTSCDSRGLSSEPTGGDDILF
jgi:hypothetical protein